ncbi:DUF6124 family protein [Pseudomonas sp. GL93]|uniref:DUF6124 family protein n=1 Tax=Pseudomonas sp. GL93 TaxID=2014741 RepID=UPI002114DC07|nr:hypothetical protein [Pseudomonas sp. GL93]
MPICYGGCAWGIFGCAGFPRFRSVNPRTAATETLSSALQTAYQCAEDPDSTQSPVIMALAQLIENAQMLVDAVLERDFPAAK